MKKLSLFFIAAFLTLNCAGRVRTVPPEYYYKVLNSTVVDSVLVVKFLVHFDGKERVAVVREDCNCVVTRRAAVSLFGYDSIEYVKPRELGTVYAILQKL